jgi:hypothetical protein
MVSKLFFYREHTGKDWLLWMRSGIHKTSYNMIPIKELDYKNLPKKKQSPTRQSPLAKLRLLEVCRNPDQKAVI